MSEQMTVPPPAAVLTCPRCGRAADADHACIPTTVDRGVVRDFIERLGFRPTDVKSLSIEPLLVDVEVYQREPEHGDRVRTLPGGHPVTVTVTVGVK